MSAPTAAFTHQPVYSPWFGLATQPPWEPGVYEVDGPGLGSGPLFSLWDGCAFGILARSREAAAEARGADGCADGVAFWRGIVPPSRLPRFVSETWAEARSRVPALVEFDGEPVAPNIANVCHLLDCKPGYELHQLLHLPGGPDVILYRRRDHS